MNTLLIPVCVVSFALNSAMTRLVQRRYPGQKALLQAYQAMFCFTASALFLLGQMLGAGPTFGSSLLPELVNGALFGLFFFTAVKCSAAGYELGSMALTSIILNLSLFVPMLYSFIVWGDTITPVRMVGVALISVTLILSADHGKGGTPLRWWLVVLLGFFANGVTAVIQKSYVMSWTDERSLLFMAIAYLTAAALFLMEALRGGSVKLTGVKRVAPLSALSGLGSFGGNALLGFLCLQVSASVLYPCVNGGLCILSALMSFLCFGERVTERKVLAIAIGALAIVLMNL